MAFSNGLEVAATWTSHVCPSQAADVGVVSQTHAITIHPLTEPWLALLDVFFSLLLAHDLSATVRVRVKWSLPWLIWWDPLLVRQPTRLHDLIMPVPLGSDAEAAADVFVEAHHGRIVAGCSVMRLFA